jgi:signal peptidase
MVLGLVAVGYLWPANLGGCTTLTIVSGHSMDPTYHTGDLVLSRCGEPEVGDVIVYQPESTGGARIIHRVIGGDAAAGWEMQGDNNDFVDPFTPRGEEVVGVARLHVPRIGLLGAAMTSPVIWLSLIALALALLLWPRAQQEEEEEEEAPDDDQTAEPGHEHADEPTDGPGGEPDTREPSTRPDAGFDAGPGAGAPAARP